MDVYLNQKQIRLDPSQSIGKGGEADVYDLQNGNVVKIFKQPDHPDLNGLPHEQKAAENRLATHQKKLPAFPRGLPPNVVCPIELATNKIGKKIVGYTMHFLKGKEVLLRYSDRSFRQAGISNESVVRIFKSLHQTVLGLHKLNVVIGDFNDLNVLTDSKDAFLIDADSFQFSSFFCQVFTDRFVDPLLCDQNSQNLMLIKPHNVNSDWYAFGIMLMQSLLFVGPYGGIYKPKDKGKKISHNARPLHRITVFDSEVHYPKPATPYGVLPDDLLNFFYAVFVKDKREDFPNKLLEEIKWTKCPACKTEHARNICPNCTQIAPAAIKEVTEIRGTVTATRFFQTHGTILFASYQNGKLRWLYNEHGKFRREGDVVVTEGDSDPQMRFRISLNLTLIAKNGQMIVLSQGKEPHRISVDSFRNLPIFDANENYYYWTNGGQLLRSDKLGSEYVGDVLSKQTLFWVGPEFGFGFYRAGNLNVAFVFDAKRRGINDNVKIPPIRGQLVDSTCVFSKTHCWFFFSVNNGGKIINQCAVIKPDGTVEAIAEAEEGDGSWLSVLRGKCAAGNFALASTDDGIVRVETNSGKIIETRKFPDTEPFVDSSSYLFPGNDGIYVVSRKEIRLLKIN